MDHVARKYRPGAAAQNRRRQGPASVWKMALLVALALGLFLSVTHSAAAGKRKSGYVAFARLSNTEKALSKKDCRNYGGRPVTESERAQVMRAARTDKYFYNVYWFDQHQYVSYKVDTSKSLTGKIGLTPYTISLCQF